MFSQKWISITGKNITIVGKHSFSFKLVRLYGKQVNRVITVLSLVLLIGYLQHWGSSQHDTLLLAFCWAKEREQQEEQEQGQEQEQEQEHVQYNDDNGNNVTSLHHFGMP
jgi:hypothetical protein